MPPLAGSVPPRLPASYYYLATAAGDSPGYSLDILIGRLIKYGNFPPVHGGGGQLNWWWHHLNNPRHQDLAVACTVCM